MSREVKIRSAGLVILGMHRSGTSALAGALGLCGAHLGADEELTVPNHENPKGFWERRDVRAICDALLHSAEADWWKIAAFEQSAIPHDSLTEHGRAFRRIAKALDAEGTWVIKEPRLCLLFGYLRTFISNPVCIHIHRNPVDVAQSLRVRNGFGLADGLSLWETYNRSALLGSAGLPRTTVSYEELVNDPETTLAGLLESLASFGVEGLTLPAPEGIHEFITPGLRHQHTEESDTAGFLLPSQQDLLSLLTSGAALEADFPGQVANPVRQQLRDFETRRSTMLELKSKLKKSSDANQKLEAEFIELTASLEERTAAGEKLKSQVAELSKRSTKLASDLESQVSKTRAAEEKLARAISRNDQLASELDDTQLQAKGLSKRTRELSGRLESTEVRLRKAEDVAAVRARELKQQVARASAAESTAKILETRLAEVYASNSWRIAAPLRAVSRLVTRLRRWAKNGFRLLGWLLTGQFGRAGKALLPRFRRHLPHSVRRLIPGPVRRLVTKRIPTDTPTGTTDSRAGQSVGEVTSGAKTSRRHAGEPTPDTSGLSHPFVTSQFGRELKRITDQKASNGFFEAVRNSEMRLAEIAARLQARPERPLVSIIMPTFNRAGIIGSAIATVLEQEYANWELLVCDDDSSDNTESVVNDYHDSRIRYFRLPKKGAAAARNAGLDNANGSIIAYLDSDNFWHPAFLNAIVLGLLENPGRSAVYADYIDFRIDASGKVRHAKVRQVPFDHERLLHKPYIDLNSFAHRRELYDCFGGFNERLKRRQDYDLILKYTWLRDPLRVCCLTTLYQRNENLTQITRQQRADHTCVAIIDDTIEEYLHAGLPVASRSKARKVTIISWDLCRNHFSKPFALAEALSADYEVQLVSFRFFDEPIFPPLEGVEPAFETVYLPGGPFPDFFESMRKALAAIDGDILYVVKPRLPSLGLALLANFQRGIPIVLEINDLETVVSAPKKHSNHAEGSFDSVDLGDESLLNPYSDLWSELMHPLARQVPVAATHNHAIDEVFDYRCIYMRNFKDEAVYDPAAYDRDAVRSELGFDKDDRVILFGGLIRKHKGIYELVELVERLDDPRYKLLFAGSRETPDQKKLIDRYGERVRVLPPQDRRSMAKINYAADLVILWLDPDVPASHYQMPYKVSDAFAMGPAVIANDISDLGTLGTQGYLTIVPFGDWDAMTRAITRLFNEPQQTGERRDAARRLFLRQFSYAAARGGFRLAAERALGVRPAALPVAGAFAERFNRLYRQATGSDAAFVAPSEFPAHGASSTIADVPGFGKAPEDASIMLFDAADLSSLALENRSGVAAIMPSLDPRRAVDTARLLVKRAGMDVSVIVVVDTGRQGFVRTLNDAARKVDVAYVAYVAEDAFPGIDWLKRAFDALERTGKGLLAFNDGKWHGRIAGFGLVRTAWVRQVYDRSILYAGYRSHKADNELTVIARIMDEFVYEPTATLVEIDRSKAIAGGEPAGAPQPSADRQLFYDRFHASFGSRFHWQDVVRHKDEYLNLRKLRARDEAAYSADDAGIVSLESAGIDALGQDSQGEIAVVMPSVDASAGYETARLLARRAGMSATYYVVEDGLRQGFIATLNAAAARLDFRYIVYVAEDAFPGEDWLKLAYEQLEASGKGLLAFNCGKWHGRVAAFGMVRKDWVEKIYEAGRILSSEYRAHKADNELTVIARVFDQLVYAPDSVLIEHDAGKEFVETEPDDKATFHRRFLSGFDRLVDVEVLKPLAKAYFVPLPPGTADSASGDGNGHDLAETTRPIRTPRSGANADVGHAGAFTSLRECVLTREKSAVSSGAFAGVLDALRSNAAQALERGTYSVTEKTTLPPSGDARDYWHPAPYWWPNPDSVDALPYVRRDGVRVPGTRMYEPDSDKYDRTRLQRVFDDSMVLALASYFFDDERFAEAGARILERFFLEPATAMHPHLKYAQVRMGHDGNQGASSGLIESKDMYFYLDAVRLLRKAGALSDDAYARFRRWLANFLDWLIESPQGRAERAAVNNHGTCYDLQVGAIASFLEENDVVHETLARARSRVAAQFGPDGSQPEELHRKSALHYCCFNLQSWINLAELSSRWGMDLWEYRAPTGACLKNAAGWLLCRGGQPWPETGAERFDVERLLPIRLAAGEHDDRQERYDTLPPNPYSVKPLFHPHDGIRPFWNLASHMSAGNAPETVTPQDDPGQRRLRIDGLKGRLPVHKS